jgi:hypothetical protein
MSEPLVNVITPATEVGLISLEDAKILLGIPASDVSNDEQLQMLIDQNSMQLAMQANRDTFAYEEVEERWDCVAPVCCPDGTCKIYLTRYPVKFDDIETVETPEGVLIDSSRYRLEQNTGKLILIDGCAGEVLIHYSGGYKLPEEAPLPLQQAAGLMVRSFRTTAAQESTVGSGVRMISHKDSRIMYFSPRDLAGGSTGSSGASMSPTDAAVKNLISKFTRLWI